jgi:hypothetical protein
MYTGGMAAIHMLVLDAAVALAEPADGWRFRLRDVVRALPHINAGTVRTHVASRCCRNAPAHHQSRHPYFRALGGGIYRIEPAFRRRQPAPNRRRAWQDALLSVVDSGVDPSLIEEALKLTPTERLEQMRRAADSMAAMRPR